MKSTLILLTSTITMALLTGCGGFESNNSTVSRAGLVPGEARIAQSRAVISMVSRNQAFANLLTCTGLTDNDLPNNMRVPASGQSNRRTQILDAMSPRGLAEDMSSGRAKALLDLSAEICGALIDKESSGDRVYFPGFTLDGNDDSGTLSVTGTAQAIASSCWGRPATTSELNIIDTAVRSVDRVNNSDGFDKALFVCTAVLSSAGAVQF